MIVGFWEALMIAGVVMLLFGAKKLPEVARGLGEGIRNFKGEMKGRPTEEHDRTLPPQDPGAPRS